MAVCAHSELWNNLQCWCKMWNEHLQADQGLWPWVRCLSPGSAWTDPAESPGLQNLPQILCPGQNTLSSLTSSKPVGVIFGFWSLSDTSLTHSSNCHTKVSRGHLHSLCSNKTHVPFISPFVKTCRYFYQTHSFMSFIEENKVSRKVSQGPRLCLFAYFRHYC